MKERLKIKNYEILFFARCLLMVIYLYSLYKYRFKLRTVKITKARIIPGCFVMTIAATGTIRYFSFFISDEKNIKNKHAKNALDKN